MTTLASITPEHAAALMKDGAILVDIREADERARERIPGTQSNPISALKPLDNAPAPRAVIYHCRSGMRTKSNAARLAEAAQCEAYFVEGGLDAWKQAGLPVEADRSQPLEMQRQVQIVAGGLILIGAAIGAFVHPAGFALSAFVGAGLTFAGISGWCGMAHLLRVMPWNRSAA